MFDLINALIALIDTAETKDVETKKGTARFVRGCLPKIEKSLEA